MVVVVEVEVVVLVVADVVLGREEDEWLFSCRSWRDNHHLVTPMVQIVPNKKPANAEFREDEEELVIVGNSSNWIGGGYSFTSNFP